MTQVSLKGIRRRGDSYVVDVTHNGKRRTATAATLGEARDRRDVLKAEMIQGTHAGPARPSVWTLGQAVTHTARHVWRGTKGERTAVLNANLAVKHFGAGTKLDAITTLDLHEWIAELEDGGNTGGTINRKLAALSRVYGAAIECGTCTVAMRPAIPRKKEPKGRIRFLTSEEEKRVVDAFNRVNLVMYADIVTVLINTGLRVGELQRLKEADAAVGEPIMVWENKADLPRKVPQLSAVREVLTHYRTGDPDNVLFQFSYPHFLRSWHRVAAALSLDGDKMFIPHALRHTCATRLAKKNVNIKTIQSWMGHRTLEITMRYVHMFGNDLDDAAKSLEGFEE